GLRSISPVITPVQDFYVVSKNFADTGVDGQGWRLHLGGLVDKPQTLTLGELQSLPSIEQYVTLECISNNVGGPQISTGFFKGVSLRDLVAMAAPQQAAAWVTFKARDGYIESLRLSMVEDSPEILFAYLLDNK